MARMNTVRLALAPLALVAVACGSPPRSPAPAPVPATVGEETLPDGVERRQGQLEDAAALEAALRAECPTDATRCETWIPMEEGLVQCIGHVAVVALGADAEGLRTARYFTVHCAEDGTFVLGRELAPEAGGTLEELRVGNEDVLRMGVFSEPSDIPIFLGPFADRFVPIADEHTSLFVWLEESLGDPVAAVYRRAIVACRFLSDESRCAQVWRTEEYVGDDPQEQFYEDEDQDQGPEDDESWQQSDTDDEESGFTPTAPGEGYEPLDLVVGPDGRIALLPGAGSIVEGPVTVAPAVGRGLVGARTVTELARRLGLVR